jgi:periplasmic protein TonB
VTSSPGPALFGWPVLASLAAHGVAIATAITVVALVPHAPPPEPAPVEMVRVEPPPPPPPPERPRPVVRRDRVVQQRMLVQRAEQPQASAPALLDDAPRRETPAGVDRPAGSAPRALTGGPASNWAVADGPGGRGGGGRLLSTKDIGLPSGGGDKPTGSTGNPEGLTSFARPLGGYQMRPRYPDSARRQGIEGEALLRFQVLTDGHVAQVTVARSAGHVDLDRAAIEAVKAWLFEPARRGQEAVAVWVTLPVRFKLLSGTSSD